jgi:mRNA interferase MazF
MMNSPSKVIMLKDWIPDRKDIIWINFSPQVGKEMKELHPMLVLSPKLYNAKTKMVIGLPMSSAAFNSTNPFAIDNSKATGESSYIICNQPKSFDWLLRGASPHSWGKVKEPIFKLACAELNDIIGLVNA